VANSHCIARSSIATDSKMPRNYLGNVYKISLAANIVHVFVAVINFLSTLKMPFLFCSIAIYNCVKVTFVSILLVFGKKMANFDTSLRYFYTDT
jgi:hypothetical protein